MIPEELEERYRQLRAQLGAGAIGPQAFTAAVAALRFQDQDGTWWQVRETDGAWLRWDGQGWVRGTPDRKRKGSGPQKQGTGPQTLKELLQMLIEGMFTGWVKNIPIVLISMAVVWFVHTYLLVFINEGFNPDNPFLAMLLVLKGNEVAGTLVWAFLGALAWAVVHKVRTGTLGASISRLGGTPEAMSVSVREAGPSAMPLLLGCGGVTLLVGALLGNALLCLQFIILLAGALVARETSIIATAFRLGWSDYHRSRDPSAPLPAFNNAWPNMGMTGGLCGFLMALVLVLILPGGFRWIAYIIGIIFVVLMFVMNRGGQQTRFTAVFSLLLMVPLALLVLVSLVRGDDGGISEATGPWIQSEGAVAAIALGAPAAVGAVAGAGIMSAADAFKGAQGTPGDTAGAPPSGPAPDMVLTDVAGKQHVYVYDPKTGAYINELTGGQLDPRAWDEYNRNLPGNQEFIEKERVKQSARDTAFDHEMDKMVADQKEGDHQLKQLQHIRENIIFGAPGTDPLWSGIGEPGDVVTKINNLVNDLTSGKDKIDDGSYEKVGHVYADAVSGRIIGEKDIPTADEVMRDTIGTGLLDSGKELVTGTKSDGSLSVLGMAGRGLIAVATGGSSEMVFTPLDSLNTMHTYVENGGNSVIEGATQTIKDVIEGAIYDKIGDKLGDRIFGKGMDALGPQGKNVTDVAGDAKDSVFKHLPDTKKSPKDLLDDITRRQNTGHTYPGLPDPTFKPSGLPPKIAGMPIKDQKAVRMVCDKHGVKGYMRPTNPLPEGSPWKGEGKTNWKPELVKQKTVNGIDKDYLGFPPGNEGIASCKKPLDLPKTKPDGIDDKKWAAIQKRYDQRLKEYNDAMKHKDHFKEIGLEWDPDTGLIKDMSNGKPFAGDHDAFVFVDAVTGKPVSPFTNQQINQDLQKAGATLHNEHMNWQVPGDKTNIDTDVLNKHVEGMPGSEPLNVYSPLDQPPGPTGNPQWGSEWYTGQTNRNVSEYLPSSASPGDVV